MKLQLFETEMSVCLLRDGGGLDLDADLFFLAKTPDELSLVCPADAVPHDAEKAEHGWRILRVEGTLDFALVGILSRLTGALAEAGVPVFAVSTFDTDYLMVKQGDLKAAVGALQGAGCEVT